MPLKLEVLRDKAAVVRRGEAILSACWFGDWVQRPFVYPFLGPDGCEVTGLGHPGDPVGHSHHRSIWIGHASVDGLDFWAEGPGSGRIEVRSLTDCRHEGDDVGLTLHCAWRDAGGKHRLDERRRLSFAEGVGGGLVMDLDSELLAATAPVVLGASPFGILGIRVAATIRATAGFGGRVINSDDAEGEARCLGQHAYWCDYSGPVPPPAATTAPPAAKTAPPAAKTAPPAATTAPPAAKTAPPAASEPSLPAVIVGIACFDHPANSPEGTQWQVRDDGWLGPGATRSAAVTISPEKPLRLRYRIESHRGTAAEAGIADRYRAWRRRALEG